MPAEGSEFLPREKDTLRIGSAFGRSWQGGGLIFLQGELGAGKTTLCRGILTGMGHDGPVRSPAYTLVESYRVTAGQVFHLDLYRLENTLELEDIGIRDYMDGAALCLVEWPERGAGLLPPPDLRLLIGAERKGRCLHWQAGSPLGEAMAAGLGG